MKTKDGIEFINRGKELSFLNKCLDKKLNQSTLIILRAPAGFGKSSLTDQLKENSVLSDRKFCIVDPSIRGRTGSTHIHDGFFLQQIASQLDRTSKEVGFFWPQLGSYLKSRKLKTVKTKDRFKIFSEMPSLKHFYKTVFDYTARAFSFGSFSPDELLKSDQAYAVDICSEYVESLLTQRQIILIIRESQHIDLHSLEVLLSISENNNCSDFIIEYTSNNSEFESEHQKLFLNTTNKRQKFHLLDLVQLESNHLEYLIKRNIDDNFNLSSDYYLSWNGNLRSVIELRFQVGIGQQKIDQPKIGFALSNLSDTLNQHITYLTGSEKMILAVILAHAEGMNQSSLFNVLRIIDCHTNQTNILKAIENLIDNHTFLSHDDGLIRIRNETIAITLFETHSMKGVLKLAEKALRDYYAKLFNENKNGVHGLANTVRQYFRLCAKTKDSAGLYNATARLSEEIRGAQDQSLYVDIVASAIEADPDLYKNFQDKLINWAASLAYSVCDWGRVDKLLSIRPDHDTFTLLMHACALQEIGGHDEALKLIEKVLREQSEDEQILAANLVKALILGCKGHNAKTRVILNSLIENPKHQQSPLLGYAYRFFEIIEGYIEGLSKLLLSIEWFAKFNLPKSKAYSQLSAAMLLARSGQIKEAKSMVNNAEIILAHQIKDQHIIVNNRCAIELLTDKPKFNICCNELKYSLRFAKDDFTELTILSNLSIAYIGNNEVNAALDCVEKCLLILKQHDFVSTEIYWPVCFNLSMVFTAADQQQKGEEILKFPFEKKAEISFDKKYWDFRYGYTSEIHNSYKFLVNKPWHPLYLSHWLIDIEGLELLKTKLP